MQYTLEYNSELAGAKLVATNTNAQITSLFSYATNSAYVHYCDPGDYAILTGFYYYLPEYPNNWYLQTDTGYWYIPVDKSKKIEEWSVTPHYKNIPVHTDEQTNALLIKIYKNNQHILENNLLCARFIQYFDAEQRQQIIALQKRLQKRNDALQDPKYVQDVQIGSPDGYAKLSGSLDALMKNGGVGIATWAFIVISVVVIGGLGAACYYTYKAFADESEADVKYSDELTAVLRNKLTEEEYQQLMDETKGIVTKARLKQAWKSSLGGIKYLALGIGGYLLYRIIKKAQ